MNSCESDRMGSHLRKILLTVISIVLWIIPSAGRAMQGGDNDYDVKKIPPEFLKGADAVVRTYLVRFEVKNRRKSKETVKRAVTILKREGRRYGRLYLTYDKFSEIDDLEGKIYDASGEKIRKLTGDDMKDYSLAGRFSFFADDRGKFAELYEDQYPYTVEYTYEISYDGSLSWPEWHSRHSLDPVELSRFEVVIRAEDTLRYSCSTDSVKPQITIDGGDKTYRWESRNSPRLSPDVYGDDIEDFATVVRIAPALFEMDEYKGDMRTWKDFGAWTYSLYQGRDQLPEQAINDVQSLMKSAADTSAKIRKLYRYLQDRTRYVLITLGIGGWQPFDAGFVHEHGYGDCKALSNYMVALLRTAGITGYPVLNQSGKGEKPLDTAFPSNQFDHVIVCVPLAKDTVWLDCTSQIDPFNHLGAFTENREVLVLTPEGGKIVRTPSTTARQNTQIRIGRVPLTLSGNVETSAVVKSTGDKADEIRSGLNNESPQDREKWLLDNLGATNATLNNYSLTGLDEHSPEIDLSLNVTLARFAPAAGDRIFFTPNLMERQTYIPPDVAHRYSPVRYDYPFLDADTIVYALPAGYKIESLPGESAFETSFGRYRSACRLLGDTALVYTRLKEIRDYSIPAEHYGEYRKFLTDIVKADKAQVVLVRKPW